MPDRDVTGPLPRVRREATDIRRRGEVVLDEVAARSRADVRARAVRLRIAAPLIAQSALAAGVAWFLANKLGDGPNPPFFAPIAAVISLGAALGHRVRRSLELVVGVALGVALGDLLIEAIGTGTVQLVLIVALAMSAAVLLDGGQLLVLQASTSSVLVATLVPIGGGVGGVDRFRDALIGGAVGMVVGLVLLPLNPLAVAKRATSPVTAGLADGLEAVAAALDAADIDASIAALSTLRGMEPTIATMTTAVATSVRPGTLESDLVHRRAAAVITADDPRVDRDLVTATYSSSYVASPVMPSGEVIGFLQVDCSLGRRVLTEVDRDNLWTFAEGFGLIFEHVARIERLQAQRTRVHAAFAAAEQGLAALTSAELLLVRRELESLGVANPDGGPNGAPADPRDTPLPDTPLPGAPVAAAADLDALTETCVRALGREGADVPTLASLVVDLQRLALELREHDLVSGTVRLAQAERGLARLRACTSTSVLLDQVCPEVTRSCGFARVLLEHRPALIEDVDAPDIHPIIRAGRSNSYLVAPIVPAGRVLGFLHADHLEDGRACDETDRDVLWRFAEGFGHLYERTALLEQMRGQRSRVRDLLATVDAAMLELTEAEIELSTPWPAGAGSPAVVPALDPDRGPSDLTRREKEVLELIVAGAANAEIAARLSIGAGTVKTHVKHILAKLGAVNRSQVIAQYLGSRTARSPGSHTPARPMRACRENGRSGQSINLAKAWLNGVPGLVF